MKLKIKENISNKEITDVVNKMIYVKQFKSCKNKDKKLFFHITNTLRPFYDIYKTFSYLNKYNVPETDLNFEYEENKAVPVQINAFEFLKENICPDNFLYYRTNCKKRRKIYWYEIKYLIYKITLKLINKGGSDRLTDVYFGLKNKKNGTRSGFITDYKNNNKRSFDWHKKSFCNKLFSEYKIFNIQEDKLSLRYSIGENNPYKIFKKVGGGIWLLNH